MIEINKKVANFSGDSTNGAFSLAEFQEHSQGKNLVIFFYPRDNTPGCTTESLDFGKLYPEFKKHNAEVIGISRDTMAAHKKFTDKYEFPFQLVADPDEEICNDFGVMKDKNMYGKKVRGIERSTFIIDKNSILKYEWRKVKIPNHVDEVLDKIKELNT